MRQKFMFNTCQIKACSPREILYSPIIGNTHQVWTYKFKGTQLIPDLHTKLIPGEYYYITAKDVSVTQKQAYKWDSIHHTTLDKALVLYKAHQRNGRENQYTPLPPVLLQSILHMGQDGYKAWVWAKELNEQQDPTFAQVLSACSARIDSLSSATLDFIEDVLVAYKKQRNKGG